MRQQPISRFSPRHAIRLPRVLSGAASSCRCSTSRRDRRAPPTNASHARFIRDEIHEWSLHAASSEEFLRRYFMTRSCGEPGAHTIRDARHGTACCAVARSARWRERAFLSARTPPIRADICLPSTTVPIF
jgi:hypothetical protein